MVYKSSAQGYFAGESRRNQKTIFHKLENRFFDILRNNSDEIKGRKSILSVVSHRGIYFPLQTPWSHTDGKQSLRLFGSQPNVSPSDLSVFYKDCYSRNPSLENLSGFLPFRSETLRFREW